MTRLFRCPACRTRRTTFALLIEHCKKLEHTTCGCGGYHHPHRPGSKFCTVNPMSDVWVAARDGAAQAELLEIEIDVVLTQPGKPFRQWRD